MDARTAATIATLRRALTQSANQAGWGYFAAKASRIEPTCWAILALSAPGGSTPPSVDAARAFLAGCQRPNGLLVEDPSLPPNLAFNGLAMLVLGLQSGSERGWNRDRQESALVQSKGLQAPQAADGNQDNSLQGWAWIESTFSWVEPTAWCMLALKQARRARASAAIDARIAEAERLLIDRCCEGGGWNYGNGRVLDQDLRPYVPTTALALIAMQDRRDHPTVARSWEYLRAHALSERSAMALALTAICARIYGESPAPIEEGLVAQWDRSGYLGNFLNLAMALYSLTGDEHGTSAFRV